MINKPVNTTYAVILVMVAIFFDALSLIPGTDTVSVLLGQIVMAGLFYLAGVNVWKERPAIIYTISTIVEIIPALGILPMFLVQTIALIVLSRKNRA